MQESEILDQAGDLIERGWCQAAFHQGEDRHCAAGALIRVCCKKGGRGFVPSYCYHFLNVAIGYPQFGIMAWNDAKERTQAEVVAAFRRAAQLARDEEAQSAPVKKPKVRELEPA